jgi:ribonuclease HI
VKYYAVRAGRQTGIFTSWDECKKQVIGFSGADYKSFLSMEDAENYMNRFTQRQSVDSQANDVDGSFSHDLNDGRAIAYVDGSYNIKTKEFSFGAVLLHDGKEFHFKEKFNDKELAEMRNVAGEIKGAEFAMRYCMENEIKKIDIYHDYEGIAKWPLGDWKTNKDGTKAYKRFYDETSKSVHINFVKVKGHSGDVYNDLADRLAKEVLGIDC